MDASITVDDVSDTMSEAWNPAMRVFVRGLPHALSTEPCDLQAGDLIRVYYPGARRSKAVTIEEKLSHPDGHFRSLDTEGFPSLPVTPGRECLLQPLEFPKLLQYSCPPGPSLLEQVLLSHGNQSMGPLRLAWPAQPVADLQVREHCVTRLAGAFPSHTTGRVPIFVDGRDVGYGVQCKASHTGRMALSTFLDSIGMFLPEPDNLLVSGSVDFSRSTRVIAVAEGDVVCVSSMLVAWVPPRMRRPCGLSPFLPAMMTTLMMRPPGRASPRSPAAVAVRRDRQNPTEGVPREPPHRDIFLQ